jgi:hypothetical protein
MTWLFEQLAGCPLVRRLADMGMGCYARRRIARLDRRPADLVQRRTLLALVRRACHTRFGRDHGFARIRTVEDYQRQVPLRDYEKFWSRYWSSAFPYLRGVTWPGPVPYFALSSGTASGATKYVPVSREMLASNQQAALTALALFLAARDGTELLKGRLFFLGGSTDLVDLTETNSVAAHSGVRTARILAGDLSGIVAREASPFLRPFTFPPPELALLSDWDRKLDLLAERAARLPITMLSGVPSWLLVLFDRLKKITGRDRVTDIWPGLRLVIHGGTRFDPYRSIFRAELGDKVALLDTYPASEGYVASEDPRFGLLRLLPDHDIFFEFVPVQELTADRPVRHTVGQVEPDMQYAVVMTTCAGLWSYVPGDTVSFERRDPPLLRFTGRTRYFLSAFGEHLISEEIERAVAAAAEACGSAVVDFHVGPVFPESPSAPGRHRYYVEFAGTAPDPRRFAPGIDKALCNMNEDYRAHRQGDLTLLAPEIRCVRPGGFAAWMRSQGKLGGQHKVPRMDNSGRLTEQLAAFFRSQG